MYAVAHVNVTLLCLGTSPMQNQRVSVPTNTKLQSAHPSLYSQHHTPVQFVLDELAESIVRRERSNSELLNRVRSNDKLLNKLVANFDVPLLGIGKDMNETKGDLFLVLLLFRRSYLVTGVGKRHQRRSSVSNFAPIA